MTSNMGSETILENFEDLDALGDKHKADIIETTKVEVFDMLKENLRPEFLNRIDEKIMFLPLSKSEIKQIALLMIKKLTKNLAKQEIGIHFDDSAMNLLADLGYEPQFGARPMTRVIQKEIVNELAKNVLIGKFSAGDTIYIGTDSKGFTFSETPVASTTAPHVKKEKDLDKLKKATKDVNDLVKDIEDEGDEDDVK